MALRELVYNPSWRMLSCFRKSATSTRTGWTPEQNGIFTMMTASGLQGGLVTDYEKREFSSTASGPGELRGAALWGLRGAVRLGSGQPHFRRGGRLLTSTGSDLRSAPKPCPADKAPWRAWAQDTRRWWTM